MSEAYVLPHSGHNLDPFEQSRQEIEDLYEEAGAWLDGEVKTQAEADGVSKLLEMLRKAAKQADARRKEEKKPHDDAAKAVQSKWKPVLDRAERAQDVSKQALTAFLRAKDEEQRRAAEYARREAEAAEAAAQAAFEHSGVGDLEEREEAEKLAAAAKSAEAEARKADKERAHAKGGSRATGLRTYYTAEIADANEFARWVWLNHRAEMEAFLLEMAQRLVRSGQRGMPGVNVIEDRRV